MPFLALGDCMRNPFPSHWRRAPPQVERLKPVLGVDSLSILFSHRSSLKNQPWRFSRKIRILGAENGCGLITNRASAWVVGWLAGRLVGWLGGLFVGWVAGWVCWLAGWRAGCWLAWLVWTCQNLGVLVQELDF